MMELGVLLDVRWPWTRVEDLARLAEELGYDQIWLNDDPLARDPFLALFRLAAKLQRIRFGLGVINASTRHPVVLAASAATLNEWTSGRFWLGLGSSTAELMDPLAVNRAPVAQRCREAALIIRQLLEDGRSSFAGKVFTTADVKFLLAGTTPVPVLIGASGGPQMLRISGEVAHGIILPAANTSFYHDVIQAFGESRRACGRTDAASVVVNGHIGLADNPEVALAAVRPVVAEALVYRAANVHSLRHMGITRQQALAWTSCPASIPEPVLREAAVLGTADECVEGLRRLANLGITQFVLRFPPESTLRTVGVQLLPRVRETRLPQ